MTPEQRLLTALDAFTDGEAHARQEIEAAVEVVLRTSGGSPGLAGAIRTALNDTHGALAAHDDGVRAEWTEVLVERLRGGL
jgi:hypothetical protein